MAQLTEDSFAFGGKDMPVDAAGAILSARVKPVEEIEIVDLRHGDGRILAHNIPAPLPLPPATNSAVDGYAICRRDPARDASLAFAIEGRIQAGAASDGVVAPGQAVRISTGAPMPRGADTVFMQGDVRLDAAGTVILPNSARVWRRDGKAGYKALLGLRAACRLAPRPRSRTFGRRGSSAAKKA
jgi:molybdopterin molybdotransferase